jgi:beta-carotene hydroxylase
MLRSDQNDCSPTRPALRELGDDLTRISPFRRSVSVISPFFWCAAYFIFAGLGIWAPAAVCVVALSFVTYGSVSHDLVHRNLGLSTRLNDRLLIAIELLGLRSGTAYRLAHLHHHRRYPADDDVEGAAAKMSFFRSLFEGVIFQAKIFRWAWKERPKYRRQIAMEGCLIGFGYLAAVAATFWTVTPLVYALLMTAGAWIIPLVTSYVPHNPYAKLEVHQTRAFRGMVLSTLAFEHLYHLEHHLYPAVPHHNWPMLARRLDAYLNAAGVRPIRLWF